MMMSLRTLALAAALVAATPALAADIEAGRKKVQEVCAACHGQDGGTPTTPEYPKLAGQYPDYLAKALRDYKSQVTAHFKGTAERVNRLTEDYRELHQHLAEGALGLCEPRQPGDEPPLLTSLGGPGYRSAASVPPSVNPPLDYAPRGSTQQPGMLNEEYDLERVHAG